MKTKKINFSKRINDVLFFSTMHEKLKENPNIDFIEQYIKDKFDYKSKKVESNDFNDLKLIHDFVYIEDKNLINMPTINLRPGIGMYTSNNDTGVDIFLGITLFEFDFYKLVLFVECENAFDLYNIVKNKETILDLFNNYSKKYLTLTKNNVKIGDVYKFYGENLMR